MCMQDESCKQLMDDMDRKCENVHAWNEYSKNDPTCSDNCLQAEFQLALNPIGKMWSECDCHVPQTQSTFSSLSKNGAFKEQCVQQQRNRRTFCYHKYSCKGKVSVWTMPLYIYFPTLSVKLFCYVANQIAITYSH